MTRMQRSRIAFSSNNNNSVTKLIEAHSHLNLLIFRSCEDLLLDVLTSCDDFRNNLNFHANSGSHSIS